jgi:hypothetical protein
MIKRYCDCCGNEITNKNKIDGENSRLTGEIRKRAGQVMLRIEVITAKDNKWNNGDFCKYCVIDAILKLDDRPKLSVK